MKGEADHHDDHHGDHHGERKMDIGHLEAMIHDDPKLAAAAQEYTPGTIEEKRLVRKMDIRLMPILWVMYIFNYIDRTNIGVGSSTWDGGLY